MKLKLNLMPECYQKSTRAWWRRQWRKSLPFKLFALVAKIWLYDPDVPGPIRVFLLGLAFLFAFIAIYALVISPLAWIVWNWTVTEQFNMKPLGLLQTVAMIFVFILVVHGPILLGLLNVAGWERRRKK